jgi:RNA polymerase subunit RPABC4/transcription elongation factor Spt4
MDCPVCGSAEAEDITAGTFDGVSVWCPRCGEYDIAGTVHHSGMLQRLDPEQRSRALEAAKAQIKTPDERPMITSDLL